MEKKGKVTQAGDVGELDVVDKRKVEFDCPEDQPRRRSPKDEPERHTHQSTRNG